MEHANRTESERFGSPPGRPSRVKSQKTKDKTLTGANGDERNDLRTKSNEQPNFAPNRTRSSIGRLPNASNSSPITSLPALPYVPVRSPRVRFRPAPPARAAASASATRGSALCHKHTRSTASKRKHSRHKSHRKSASRPMARAGAVRAAARPAHRRPAWALAALSTSYGAAAAAPSASPVPSGKATR